MPDAVDHPRSGFPDKVKQEKWWMWPGTAHLIATEYVKYLAARLRHWAEPLGEVP